MRPLPRSPRRWTLASAVAAALFSPAYWPAPALAQNVWQGGTSSEITDADNWSENLDSGNYGDVVINAGTPNDPVWTIGGPSANPSIDTQSMQANSLAIGNSAGSPGHLTVNTVLVQDYGGDGYIYLQSASPNAFTVGSNGGTGTLDLNLSPGSVPGTTLRIDGNISQGLSVGLGTGSTGTVNLLGQGKSAFSQSTDTRYNSGTLQSYSANQAVGVDGGTGTVNIQDAAWVTSRGAYDPSTGLATGSSLILGVGTGSVGSINILSGGKLSISAEAYRLEGPTRIGADGGSGTLSISGTNANDYASNASFSMGLDIGRGSGSTGAVNVLSGGKVLNWSRSEVLDDPDTGDRLTTPPVQLGLDGGSGQATVSGAGSIWYVGAASSSSNYRYIDNDGDGNDDSMESLDPIDDGTQIGHLHVGVSGSGSLTIADGSVVSLGTAYVGYVYEYLPTDSRYYYGLVRFDDGLGTLYLGETVSGNGVLNIGAAAGSAAVAPGELRAAQVLFGPGTGSVVFNHTGADYVFDTPLVGTGVLANYAGTTWLQPAATPPAGAPLDNSAFSGTTELHGGALGLGYNAALGSSAVQVLGDATLLYANAVAISNSINLQGAATLSASVAPGEVATQAGVITGSGNFAKIDGGTLLLTGADTYTGETRVSAGTLALAGAGSIAQSSRVVADAIFDISAATPDVFIRSLSGAGTVNFGNNALTLTAAADTFAGQLAGSGAFVVAAGHEVLTGDSGSFAGPTTVAGGELWVNGSLGTAATLLTVQAGGLLGGSGRVGGQVEIADGGTLVPGPEAAIPGELNIDGNLTLAPTATMRFLFGEAGVAGGPLNDLLSVGGNLVLDGTLQVETAPGGTFEPGVYRVIDYAGTLDDRGLALGTLPPALSSIAVQTSVAQQVNLVLAPAGITLNFWDGASSPRNDGHIDGGDGVWQSSAGNDNWTDANGTLNAPFQDGSFAIFEGDAGTVTVDGSLGAIQVDGMQFGASGYVVRGDPITLLGPDALIRVGVSALGRTNLLGVAPEHTTTIESALIGDARLVKSDAGTLVLSGQNSYSGGTYIREGILQIAADSALGASNGALAFGFGALRTTATMGSARAMSVETLAALLPAQDTTLTLSGAISGSGMLAKGNMGTLVLEGDSPFSGATWLAAGVLKVDGSLAASAVTVDSGAELGGNGTTGAATLHAGARIAPGSSIGTLSINGGLSQEAGSIYVVEVDPASTASDLIQASGTATIADGAQLQVVRVGDALYRPGNRYTVLSANGGVSGDYALGGDVAISPFLALADTYDPTHAYLQVTQVASLEDINCAPNAHATAGGTAGLGIGGTLSTALLNQPDVASACDALGQLSGEIHASLRGALLEDSRFLREAVGIRVRGAGEDALPPADAAAGAEDGLWAHVFGSWGRFDHGRDTRSLSRDIGGLFVGADWELPDNWRLGIVGGYSTSDFDVDAWHSSASSDDTHLGVYAGGQWDNGFSVHGGAAYTWHDIEANRRVDFAHYSDQLRADYDADTRQVYAEFGYRFQPARVALQPFLNVAYVQLDSDGFQERGGEAALRASDTRDELTYATLGMRVGRVFDTQGGGRVSVRAMAGWRRVFGDRSPDLGLAFVSGGPFAIEGVPLARNALAAELGVDAALGETVHLGVMYSGQLGAGVEDHGAKAYLEWRF